MGEFLVHICLFALPELGQCQTSAAFTFKDIENTTHAIELVELIHQLER